MAKIALGKYLDFFSLFILNEIAILTFYCNLLVS